MTPTQDSDTPRAETFVANYSPLTIESCLDFARQLERELAAVRLFAEHEKEARAELVELRAQLAAEKARADAFVSELGKAMPLRYDYWWKNSADELRRLLSLVAERADFTGAAQLSSDVDAALADVNQRPTDAERINHLSRLWDSQGRGHHLMGHFFTNPTGAFRDAIDADMDRTSKPTTEPTTGPVAS